MRAALSKTAIETQLASRFGHDVFKLTDRGYAEVISTGLAEIDALAGGLPRGAITEIYGSESSGRTSLFLSALAYATTHEEVCALVDTNDVLDPKSSANTGVNLERLLWIRCAGNLEHSFKAVDLLLQGGGFGLVALDLGDVQAKEARRIISSWWYRFRRVVENTPTALVVITQASCVRSCASLTLALASKESVWSKNKTPEENGFQPRIKLFTNPFETTAKRLKQSLRTVTHGNILRSKTIEVERVKPMNLEPCRIEFRI
jgi:recombination protein RecA